jgi:tyrosyl-tRNA synthetase
MPWRNSMPETEKAVPSFFEEMEWRGLVYSATDGLRDAFKNERITAYIGFDPTASSLHVGSLLTIMGLVRLQQFGHSPIAVAGGGTGLIGDPSGKATERPLMSKEEVQSNIEAIKRQLQHFLDFESKVNPARMVNNADWLTSTSITDFLRDIGKHFSVNALIAKESVKRRMDGDGISYTELSYILLQSFDFLTLFERLNCTLQMGGSDQWGNITAGVDLIRRVHGKTAHALVYPLLTTSSGAKMGKSEKGAIWLDPDRTSPYRLYQYLFNTDDRDVVTYLKTLTLMSPSRISELALSGAAHPEQREGQRELARDVTRRVHGDDALARAEVASKVLFGEAIRNLSLRDVLDIFSEAPSVEIGQSDFLSGKMTVADLMVSSGLSQSKGEARRLIEGGGVYLQNVRVTDARRTLSLSDGIEGQAFVIRKGQREYRLVKVASQALPDV